MDDRIVTVTYANWKGVTSDRRIVPTAMWFGSTSWHPGRQWLMDAFDVDKGMARTFAMKDIKAWNVEAG